MGEWVYMVHAETGGVGRFPDRPGVVTAQESRGWVVAEDQLDPDAAETPAEPKKPTKTASKKAESSAADNAGKE